MDNFTHNSVFTLQAATFLHTTRSVKDKQPIVPRLLMDASVLLDKQRDMNQLTEVKRFLKLLTV